MPTQPPPVLETHERDVATLDHVESTTRPRVEVGHPTDTAAGPAPVQEPASAAVRLAGHGTQRHVRRPVLLVAAAFVTLGVAAGVTGAAVSQTGGTTRPPGAAATRTGAPAIATWLSANAGSNVTVVGNPLGLTGELSARGIRVTRVDSLDAAPTGAYLVAARADVARGTGDGRAYISVARFSGTDTFDVGQLSTHDDDRVARDRAAERTTVVAAGTGLLANRTVDVAPSLREDFTRGRLDLRAAAFVVLLAGSQHVSVVAAPEDAAEAAAALPVRRLVVEVADVSEVRAAAASAHVPYAPVVSTTGASPGNPAQRLQLTWPVVADPSAIVA